MKKAPKGMFRVICVDTFSHEDWVQGDFTTIPEAIGIAKEHSGNMLKSYVYDENGNCLSANGIY